MIIEKPFPLGCSIGGRNVRYVNTSVLIGLSVWILGFVLMAVGWLIDVLFEKYGAIPAKVFYKTGALIVAVPVIYLLWKTARLIYVHRLETVLFIREAAHEVESLVAALKDSF